MGGGHDMHGGHNGGVKGFVSNLVHGGGGGGHGGHGGHGYPPPATGGAYPPPHGAYPPPHGAYPPATYPAHTAHYGTGHMGSYHTGHGGGHQHGSYYGGKHKGKGGMFGGGKMRKWK